MGNLILFGKGFRSDPGQGSSGSGQDDLTILKTRPGRLQRVELAWKVLFARNPKLVDALNHGGVVRGIWHVDRYDAPIEWYAERLARSRGTQDDVDATLGQPFERMPEHIRLGADRLLKANHQPFHLPGVDDYVENLFLTNGVNAIWNLVTGNASSANTGASPAGANAAYNNAQASIGVGDSSTAASAGQTDLQAASNKTYKGMDATYPTISTNQISFRVTMASSDANYAWAEFVVTNRNGSNSLTSGGTAMDRLVSSQGTKASGQTWQPTLTSSIS